MKSGSGKMMRGISAQELAAVSPTREAEILGWLALHGHENYLIDETCATIYHRLPQ